MASFFTPFSWHFLFIYRRCCCSLPWSLTTTRHQRPQRARPSNAMTSDLSCCQNCAGVRMEPLPHCGHHWSLRVQCVSLCLVLSFSKGYHVFLVTWLRGNNDVFLFFSPVFVSLTLLVCPSCSTFRRHFNSCCPPDRNGKVFDQELVCDLLFATCTLNMFGHHLRGDWQDNQIHKVVTLHGNYPI